MMLQNCSIALPQIDRRIHKRFGNRSDHDEPPADFCAIADTHIE